MEGSENGWKLRLCECTALAPCYYIYPASLPLPPSLGRGQGFCAMCELQSHVQKVMNQSGGVVRPMSIVQNLRGEAAAIIPPLPRVILPGLELTRNKKREGGVS